MNRHKTLGWDVGGAHLKAAVVDADGKIVQVLQLPCPLWRGMQYLSDAIDLVLAQLADPVQQHAVTMTGELVDLFPDRQSGVMQIADMMSQKLDGKVAFYAGEQGFVAIADVAYNASSIASANWLASASWLAKQIPDALFVDIGSTTSDLILLHEGQPAPKGNTDAARMQYQELIYSGVVRSPLMSIARELPFDGEYVTLAAEHFATTADVYRLTGELDEASDMAETADGGAKTAEASARRLARMIGRDAGDASHPAWVTLACSLRQQQLNRLYDAASRILSRQLIASGAPIIGAGCGKFLIQRLARQLDRPYVDAANLFNTANADLNQWVSICLPACAVASLLN